MRQSCCFVPLCSNRGGMPNTFPKDDVLRKKWIVAIRRQDESNHGKLWSPSASSPVCHKHFTEDVFIKTNQAGFPMTRKILRPGVVPSQFSWTADPNEDVRMLRAEEREKKMRKMLPYITLDVIHCQGFSVSWDSLGPAAYQLTYWQGIKPKLIVQDQLLLVLMKIRMYKPNFVLSHFFNVSENDVQTIFATWIRFMSLQWREIDVWPDKELIQFYAPSDFRRKFPSTRLVIDGVEISVKKPSKPMATFSTYKNRNTAKALVGITPGGMVSYVSNATVGPPVTVRSQKEEPS
ncbi:hypothetical protein CAPTEDRAFT_191582 [Capitella teleta]|uniref:THAP-type domain-containing protein n=1 Tax=Capitella teleta TaxID=283909 RepID=R7TAI1_CAPTE|nr:hypothetical protein CAPTEDRAFT_191582 [Capitella teleta]|eukprot:ELT90502.1 hypothetical protein CAPTEDRAFT_191582 [Capitella teleta]